jgi:hypothetical protein
MIVATDFWQWIERVSWIASILVLLATAFLILVAGAQLIELLNKYLRHSDLVFGFKTSPDIESPIVSQCRINTTECDQPGLWEAVVTFWSQNDGDASASGLVYNYSLPKTVGSPDMDKKMETISGESIIVPMLGGGLNLISRMDFLHPKTAHRDTIRIRMAPTVREFPVEASLYRTDREPIVRQLRVFLDDAPSGSPVEESAQPLPQPLDAPLPDS